VISIDGCGERFESLERGCMRLLETHDQIVVGTDTEVFDNDPHRCNRALEVAADVSERCRVGDRSEGAPDVAFTGRKGEPVGDKAHDRNERQKNDAGADRE
jgi:hypothetical protein